jgi:hypothetical protein
MNHDAILEALDQQVVCYRRLAKLAEQQHEHVRQSRTEELLSVLGQRQQVLDQAAELERSIVPASRRWSDYLGDLPQHQRTRAQELMAERRKLLEQITASDSRDVLVLQQRKIDVGLALRKTAMARQVNRSYAANAYVQRPASMDLRS